MVSGVSVQVSGKAGAIAYPYMKLFISKVGVGSILGHFAFCRLG
jgi:hypothetical protein